MTEIKVGKITIGGCYSVRRRRIFLSDLATYLGVTAKDENGNDLHEFELENGAKLHFFSESESLKQMTPGKKYPIEYMIQ